MSSYLQNENKYTCTGVLNEEIFMHMSILENRSFSSLTLLTITMILFTFGNHRIFCHAVTNSSRSLICADKLNAVSVLVSLFKLSFTYAGFV